MLRLLAFLGIVFLVSVQAAPPALDLRQAETARSWQAAHDARVSADPEGLRIEVTGEDPYLVGPSVDFDGSGPLWLRVRLRASQVGMAQLFWFEKGASETDSVRFLVPTTNVFESRVPVPNLRGRLHLRFDPPGSARAMVRVERIAFEDRILIAEPAWPRFEAPVLGSETFRVGGPGLEFVQDRGAFGAFGVRVAGRPFAVSGPGIPVGYRAGGTSVWFHPGTAEPVFQAVGASLRFQAVAVDPDGGQWTWERRVGPAGSGLEIRTKVSVDRRREVVFLPATVLLAGVGTFGTNKHQALLSGVEYLENEDSSSERDLVGPGALRRVPDSAKLTQPLMAVAADDRWLSLDWRPGTHIAALFDTPDRVFGSGGHLLGVIAPGSDGTNRPDGALMPYEPGILEPGKPMEFVVVLRGGPGRSVVPAIQGWVGAKPLPTPPDPGMDRESFLRLQAAGWLESDLRDGVRYRHAVGPNFGSAPAVDAALWMKWLAPFVGDVSWQARLERASDEAFAATDPSNPFQQVGHVRWHLPGLVRGDVTNQLGTLRRRALETVRRAGPEARFPYAAPSAEQDLARTHWEREANGLASEPTLQVLRAAALTGDAGLRADGLRLLAGLSRWRGGVPRGAQTWEVPLHTPDILGSAQLCEAYVLAYELTGERNFLDEARHWAWTGVPFVYLVRPSEGPVGLYATTPVLGATQFVAPNWIGLPVQWCGLVYAEALRHLSQYDDGALWGRIADGIAASGVQQVHPASEPRNQGLLPDSFDLKGQFRNPVPINPGTLLPGAVRLYGGPPVQQSVPRPAFNGFVHAPGYVAGLAEKPGGGKSKDDRRAQMKFTVALWPEGGGTVLVTGVDSKPSSVSFDGKKAPSAAWNHDAANAWLLLRPGSAHGIEVRW